MKFTNKSIVRGCLERIAYLQELTKHLMTAQTHARRLRRGRDEIDTGNIYDILIEAECEEWRGLLMWGLTLENKEREDIKAMAKSRFFSESTSVAHWLSEDGITPASYLESDEQEFRELVRKHFSPPTVEEVKDGALKDICFALIRDGRKIQAIKEYRTATGTPLKVAKDQIDQWEREIQKESVEK